MNNQLPKSSDCFPLSLNQHNIWDLECSFPGTSINCISTTIRIRGRVDFPLLQKAINLVLQSDDSLRARIVLSDDSPVQYNAPYREEVFPVFDFSMTDEEGIRHWENTITRETLPLENEPLYRFILFRVDKQTAGIFIKMHHIISDGWTQVNLCNRIGQTYLDLLSGNAVSLEEAPVYRHYVEAEQDYLNSKAYDHDRVFWKETLSKAGGPAAVKSIHASSVSPAGRRMHCPLPQTLNHAIYSYCYDNHISPFLVFYMALAIYLKKTGGSDRSIIGVPIFNRSNYSYKKTSGMFVSTLPFVNELDENWNLDEFRDSLAENWLDMLRHQRFPFPHIAGLANHNGPLFNVALSYQDGTILDSHDASVRFSGSWHYSGYQAEHLCIHLTNLEDHKRYNVDYDYLTQIFTDNEIKELHNCICHIMTSMLESPRRPIHELPLLNQEKQEQVLYAFNQTSKINHADCLYGIFQNIVEKHPNRAALIYQGEHLTYRDLTVSAGRVAAALGRNNGLTAVILPRTPALFAALIGIIQAGGAWMILPPDLPPLRIKEILRQSEATAVVSDRQALEAVGLNDCDLPLVDMEDLPDPISNFVAMEPSDLAYVVYTSGSTGQPKGVEITQSNLLNLVFGMQSLYARGAVLSLSNPSFDAFMLESVVALLNARTIVLPEDAEQENPDALARLITGYAVGFMALTPSRLSEYLKNLTFQAAMQGMESIICGGEAFPRELLTRLNQCTSARVYNQYGPSETTVAVSYKLMSDAELITAGKPMENCRLYILNDHLQPLPIGVLGELYIGGQCVGRGYRNMPEQTAASFLPNPFETNDTLYRSGDMAYWTSDGEIVISGRRDRQVKLRGLRVEPQEITDCLASHPAVTAAAARVWEDSGQTILVAYYTSPTPLAEAELLTHTAAYLPHYMIPSRIIRLSHIPLSANGKVDDQQLPYPATSETVIAPANELQQTILEIFRDVLKKSDLHAASDYFLCGGNSLNAMETIGRLEKVIGRRLRVSDLYACRTVSRLEEFLSGETTSPLIETILPAPLSHRYPLSPIQKNIYVQSFLDPSGLAYQMPGAFRLNEAPDLERLNRAFSALINEDDNFRTAFIQQNDGVYAHIAQELPFAIEILQAPTFEDAYQKFLKPFDLSKAPLLKAALWEESPDRPVLFIDMHHIISDGISTPIMLKRLSAHYGDAGSSPLTEPTLTYKDYTWHVENTNASADPADHEYWQNCLLPLPQPLDLPLDFARPAAFDYKGGRISFQIPAALSRKIDAYCEQHEITSFMFFASVFGILLSKLSGQDDLLIGVPVSYRERAELADVCGPLMGTLPLRLNPTGPLDDYFRSIRDRTLGMMDHKHFSLDEILSMLDIPRDLSRNPLYQALFSLRPINAGQFHLDGQPIEYLPAHNGTAKLDLNLEAYQSDDSYHFDLEYASSLFLPETIALYGRSYETLLYRIVTGNFAKVEDLDAISDQDREHFIDRPSRRYLPYQDRPIHYIFEDIAAGQPDKTAVIWHNEQTSFKELEEKASRVAGQLVQLGVNPGDKIAFCIDRTPDLFAGMLGILKAGAAYVPVLSDYPEQRLAYMIENSGSRFLLADAASLSQLPQTLPCPIVAIDPDAAPLLESIPRDGADTIYILYTSGSTGQPKGVSLPHRSISNLLENIRCQLDGQTGPVLCSTNVTFDIFITESLLALAQGLTVVLADADEMMLPWELARLMTTHHTKITQFTPSRLQLNLNNSAFAAAASEIAFVILVGENVSPQLVEQFKTHSQGRFMNMYGPTEAAVYVTSGEQQAGRPVTIGRPFDNCRIYVLDPRLKPVLPTARGELYLAGDCLADGYVGRSDLTEQVFLPDPILPGQRMYKSGDIGRLRADGDFECLGRSDTQLKINGNRVELDEINEGMANGGASQAVTVPLFHPDGSASLHAFV
ncbi:MAG TPA: amino acid adenylation domain-containing protein, partial [Clostridiales bacterium]|nr:amino acid adenylation domain-containing protein [Clostridiales bacterium]